MVQIEHITFDGKPLVYIIRGNMNPLKTDFLTPVECNVQVGFIVYPKGSEIARHVHLPIERHIVGTTEVLLVKKGRCLMDIYNDEQKLVATRELHEGDIIAVVAGGHGFSILDDTVFLEIKQGPYTGLNEKERF